MKKLIIVSALAAIATITACDNSKTESSNASTGDSTKTAVADTTQTFTLDTNKLASGATFYQCEMHAEVLSDKPGMCPECDMDLSPIVKH